MYTRQKYGLIGESEEYDLNYHGLNTVKRLKRSILINGVDFDF
jgi:hypothetical protein